MAKDKNKDKAKKSNKKESGAGYFAGVKQELSKVVWPTKKELVSYTVVVIATCAAFALGFWLMDLGILEALKQVLGVTLS